MSAPAGGKEVPSPPITGMQFWPGAEHGFTRVLVISNALERVKRDLVNVLAAGVLGKPCGPPLVEAGAVILQVRIVHGAGKRATAGGAHRGRGALAKGGCDARLHIVAQEGLSVFDRRQRHQACRRRGLRADALGLLRRQCQAGEEAWVTPSPIFHRALDEDADVRQPRERRLHERARRLAQGCLVARESRAEQWAKRGGHRDERPRLERGGKAKPREKPVDKDGLAGGERVGVDGGCYHREVRGVQPHDEVLVRAAVAAQLGLELELVVLLVQKGVALELRVEPCAMLAIDVRAHLLQHRREVAEGVHHVARIGHVEQPEAKVEGRALTAVTVWRVPPFLQVAHAAERCAILESAIKLTWKQKTKQQPGSDEDDTENDQGDCTCALCAATPVLSLGLRIPRGARLLARLGWHVAAAHASSQAPRAWGRAQLRFEGGAESSRDGVRELIRLITFPNLIRNTPRALQRARGVHTARPAGMARISGAAVASFVRRKELRACKWRLFKITES
eukprot:6202929-Pleurochrysis_carterae.AAC.2